MTRRVRAGAIIVGAAACAVSCAPGPRAGGPAAEPPARTAPDTGAGSVRAGELPDWWIGEPRAVGSVVIVSASGTAPEASVARDLAVRNARAAGRAVLGVEPVRVEVTREVSVQSRPGEFEAFVLARCDAAGAAALQIGGERMQPRPAGERASAERPRPAPDAPDGAAAAAPSPEPGPQAPAAGAAERDPRVGAAPNPAEAPTWWFEDVRRDGGSVRACARAEGPRLLDTRRAAVEAVGEKLKALGVTGPVQTLFIATRKPPDVAYRVYVMGQGELGK